MDQSDSDIDMAYLLSHSEPEPLKIAQIVPHVPVIVYTSKFTKPIKVVTFLDTGAAQTIMNPSILPENCWKPHDGV